MSKQPKDATGGKSLGNETKAADAKGSGGGGKGKHAPDPARQATEESGRAVNKKQRDKPD